MSHSINSHSTRMSHTWCRRNRELSLTFFLSLYMWTKNKNFRAQRNKNHSLSCRCGHSTISLISCVFRKMMEIQNSFKILFGIFEPDTRNRYMKDDQTFLLRFSYFFWSEFDVLNRFSNWKLFRTNYSWQKLNHACK